MGNRMTKTVLFAASALLSMGAFGAGAARFGTLRNSDWVVTNAWQAVSNKTHDLILEMGQESLLPPNWQNVSNFAMNAVQSLQPAYDYTDNALISFSSTGTVFRSLSYGTPTRWTDATGCVWQVEDSIGGWMSTTSAVQFTDWNEVDPEIDLWKIFFNVDGAGANGYAPNPTGKTSYTLDVGTWQYDETDEYGDFDVTFVRPTIPGGLTNFVGRVALTNDISQAISTNNSAFVSAVLAAPLVGADPSDLSEIAEYGTYGTVGAALLALIAGLAALKRGKLDGTAVYPAWVQDDYQPPAIVSHKGRLWRCQNYTISEPGEGQQSDWLEVTIEDLKQDSLSSEQMDAVNSGATAAKVAAWDGYVAQIAQKADATDLPYAMVTPGEWEFSGLPEDATGADMSYDNGYWTIYIYYDGETDSATAQGSESDLVVAFSNGIIVATRPSLPGHLLDRANNLIDATTGNVTLTLPPFVAGKVRDLLVACTIGLDGNDEPWSVIFQGQGSEAPSGADEISFKAEGDDSSTATFPVPDAAGDWWYSLTERAPHVFAVSLKQLQDVSQPTQTQGGS